MNIWTASDACCSLGSGMDAVPKWYPRRGSKAALGAGAGGGAGGAFFLAFSQFARSRFSCSGS